MSKKFVSFFSGAGGLDTGFILNGWIPLLLADFWLPAVNTLRKNHPNTLILDWDISKVTDTDISNVLKKNITKVDVVTGGPPCQAFSRLNQNQLFDEGKETDLNLDDPRRSLFMDFLRVVSYINPKAVVMENVSDIVTRKLGGTGLDRDRLIVDIIKEEFNKIGYIVEANVLNAIDYNVPQLRKRIIFIGIRSDLNVTPSIPFIFGGLQTSVREELAKIHEDDPNQDIKKHSKEWIDKVKYIPPGGYYKHLPTKLKVRIPVDLDFVFSYTGADKNFCFKDGENLIDFKVIKKNTVLLNNSTYSREELTSVIKDCELYRVMPRMGTYLRRAGWDISHTITRNPIIHPEQNRELTVREKAAIQTFPHNYEFCGSIQEQHVLVGNAVPCNLAFIIAEHLNKELCFEKI
jgi:DNA (cytosine-5)-methyltransferase 1